MTKQAIQLAAAAHAHLQHLRRRRVRPDLRADGELIVMVAVLLATVGFGSSSALVSAYGTLFVTVTMFITTLLTLRRAMPEVLCARARGDVAVPGGRRRVCRVPLAKDLQGGCPARHGAAGSPSWRRGGAAAELLIEHIRQRRSELLPFVRSSPTMPRHHQATVMAVYAVANPDTVPQALTCTTPALPDAAMRRT